MRQVRTASITRRAMPDRVITLRASRNPTRSAISSGIRNWYRSRTEGVVGRDKRFCHTLRDASVAVILPAISGGARAARCVDGPACVAVRACPPMASSRGWGGGHRQSSQAAARFTVVSRRLVNVTVKYCDQSAAKVIRTFTGSPDWTTSSPTSTMRSPTSNTASPPSLTQRPPDSARDPRPAPKDDLLSKTPHR